MRRIARAAKPQLIFDSHTERLWRQTGIGEAILKQKNYVINGVGGIELQHLYRAMLFLGEALSD